MMPPSNAKLIQRAIKELEKLKSPKHWLATSRLADRLGVPEDGGVRSAFEESLKAHAESPEWVIRYSYYPSGKSLELLWGHQSNVGKQRNLPSLNRTDPSEDGDVGPDNFDSWIFISHNSGDEIKVREVAEVVKGCGFGPWIFQQQIERGASIVNSVRTAIDECKHFIVYVSPQSLPSLWVEKELRVHFRLAGQDSEKETIVIPDGSEQGFADALEGAIAGKPVAIEKLTNLPFEKQQDRSDRMLKSLAENEDRIRLVRFSGEGADLKNILGELKK